MAGNNYSNFCISLAVNMRGIRLALFLALVLLQANIQVCNLNLIRSRFPVIKASTRLCVGGGKLSWSLHCMHLHLSLQEAESKQTKEASSQVNVAIHKVLHISDILFKGLVGQHTSKGSRARYARQTGFGTCSDHDLEGFFSSYPSSCAQTIGQVNPSALVSGELEEFTEFTNAFCDKKCGQPIVGLFRQCGLQDISNIFVYICKLNEDGNTCGSVFPAVNETGANAVNACGSPHNTHCSSACLQTLDNLRSVAGCCANTAQIDIGQEGAQVVDYNELYELCGEDTIEPCTEGILSSGNAPTFTVAVGGLTALVLTVTVLLL